MKATYEHVARGVDQSIRVYHRRLRRIPFEWHHHPEYELTLTMNSHGKRYIGDSVAAYQADDLVLVPPNMPHTWASNRSLDSSQPEVAIVIWFDGAWVQRFADLCPEYSNLRGLLRRAACGLAFEDGAGTQMREHLGTLLDQNPKERLKAALNILDWLSDLPASTLASPSAYGGRIAGTERTAGDSLNRVLALIDTQFDQQLQIPLLAKAAGISERSLARQFVQHVGESVGRYITKVRIGHACRILVDTTLPVSVVATQSGFPNVANFNRQFRAAKTLTPSEYRQQYSDAGPPEEETHSQLTVRSPSLRKRSGAPD